MHENLFKYGLAKIDKINEIIERECNFNRKSKKEQTTEKMRKNLNQSNVSIWLSVLPTILLEDEL